jgi:hypothetical protein
MAEHLVQILLPLDRRGGEAQPRERYGATRDELVERCGGVTIYARAPAEGLWDDGGSIVEERVVVFEAMDARFSVAWWAAYKCRLAERFEQEEVLVRAIPVSRI